MERLGLGDDWLGFDFWRRTIKFSDECSVAYRSGHNVTWVWQLPADKWSREMVEEVTIAH